MAIEEKKKKLLLTCKDVGVECDVKFIGDTPDEIMTLARKHAAAFHNLPDIPPEIEKKCRASIRPQV